jgi:hypothetical protein
MDTKTPVNNRIRRKSSSSISNSTRRKRKSMGSCSKMTKMILVKDRLRKLNHYKESKKKRAELFENRRHICDNDRNNLNVTRDIDNDDMTDDNEDDSIYLNETRDVSSSDEITGISMSNANENPSNNLSTTKPQPVDTQM